MHIHILGICGTFMGGIAALAKAAGHEVTGCDAGVYPPMSAQLKKLGIDIHDGFDARQLESPPDCVVVGNVVSRGFDVVESMLDRDIAYQSGPQWLAEHVLRGQHVFAVAGTHGKTTTASLLAWILEDAGLQPGFLIGGVPANFGVSARYGGGDCFVVEADEYDTAFFDKRAKFVHYRPRTLILNNLEYDHADIYKDLDAILWQFHQLMRTVPGSGRVIVNAADDNIARLVDMGCWTPCESFSTEEAADWRAEFVDASERRIRIRDSQGGSAEARWQLGGSHNLENAVAAVAAARSAGVELEQAVDALTRFEGVKRRMERTATVGDIAIYDDFAHHPTAIRRTIAAMKRRYPGNRLVVAIEPRSNTMKLGVHNREFAESLEQADLVWMYRPAEMDENFDAALTPLGKKLRVFRDYDELASDMSTRVLAGDQVVFMSNGGFGGARQTLTAVLQRTRGS
ncbi:MAG TPA: UDP-N-acetylmuramate:L-alanyl-gamma-D-glutamyl-meso-diaminopimelate ligase [Woeseiaceae bacterium]|nr:UDP-N-acetylmuramate:L-alanyl-gamma-D-glutamyl-meso-diaminopimelate ligase [Woeseiaceae bacterium]